MDTFQLLALKTLGELGGWVGLVEHSSLDTCGIGAIVLLVLISETFTNMDSKIALLVSSLRGRNSTILSAPHSTCTAIAGLGGCSLEF